MQATVDAETVTQMSAAVFIVGVTCRCGWSMEGIAGVITDICANKPPGPLVQQGPWQHGRDSMEAGVFASIIHEMWTVTCAASVSVRAEQREHEACTTDSKQSWA
jgi:hypothetical protein